MTGLSSPEARLALALAIGLLIGTERERRRAEQVHTFAGLRTFGLAGLLGGLFAYTGTAALMVTGAALVGLFAIAAYAVNRDDPDRGMTTELALVVTYALGLAAIAHPGAASALAVAVTALLALRGRLHHWVRNSLTEVELRDGLLFLLFALVVLPVAPDVPIGPYRAINPQALTRLVVVLMLVSGLAHVAQRAMGARFGLPLTGFVAGFVSSSATIASLSLRAREKPESYRAAIAGAFGSSVATVVQYGVIVLAVDPGLARALAPALGLAFAVALLQTLLVTWSLRDGAAADDGVTGRPFRLSAALGFAAVFAIVSVAAAALRAWVGDAGIVLVSVVAAFVDAHSTAASVAALHHSGAIDAPTAELAIVGALSANSVTKIVLAWSGRSVRYGAAVSAGVLAITLAAWVGARLL